MQLPSFSVSEFVAVFNQTLEFAYPSVSIIGELANFRINKNQWVRFDLKDEESSVSFFGTVYNLPGPIEEGMLLCVHGIPRLHPKFGFSVNIRSIELSGEGTIKRAFKLLEAKLAKEGLFDEARKRALPYPPVRIGLITSGESAAYADFCKILQNRWSGIEIEFFDTQVQGELAARQLLTAIEHFNSQAEPPDVLVITRGGGSADDLAIFNSEPVVRAVAASRVPTLAAIGHEIDLTLVERAADRRASTPSNAAEILVPDKGHINIELTDTHWRLGVLVQEALKAARAYADSSENQLHKLLSNLILSQKQDLMASRQLLSALNPKAILKRGYAIVRDAPTNKAIKTAKALSIRQNVKLEFGDGVAQASVNGVE